MVKCIYKKRITNDLLFGSHEDVPEFEISKYKDRKHPEIIYRCTFEAQPNSSLCIFHDPNYAFVDKQDRLNALIEQSNGKSKPLVFVGFYLNNFRLTNVNLNKAYFIRCIFSGTTTIIKVSSKETYFGSSEIAGLLTLAHSNLGTYVDFSGVTFHDRVLFLNKNVFSGEVKFCNSHFKGAAQFRYNKFTKLTFANTTFDSLADFLNVHVILDCIFFSSKFFGSTIFSYATFFQSVQLEYIEFHEDVDFLECEIKGYISLKNVKFLNKTTFDSAKISEAQFDKCDFDGEVSFDNTKFPSIREYWFDLYKVSETELKMTMEEKLNYEWINDTGTRVQNIGSNNVTIESSDRRQFISIKVGVGNKIILLTERGKLPIEFTVRKADGTLKVYRLNKFEKEIQKIPVTFNYSNFNAVTKFTGRSDDNLNLELVSFKGIDLRNFEFHNIRFIEKRFRNVIIDEQFLPQNKNYFEVSRIYNQLRKNYETILAFNEASNFFIGEMDVTRKSLASGSSKQKFSALGYLLYKFLALYGESTSLPLFVWTPIVITLFTFLRFLVGYCSIPHECSSFYQWVDSVAAFFQVPRGSGALDIAERIVSAPILGTVFIAVRRKFERKK